MLPVSSMLAKYIYQSCLTKILQGCPCCNNRILKYKV